MKKLASNLKRLVILLNDGEFHSGDNLGKTLNITRSGVWKFITQLQKLGIAIESLKGKGYRLKQPLILLDADAIQKHLVNPPDQIEIFGSIPSTTNSHYWKHKLSNQSSAKFICLAEQQTAGRGRLGRSWHSPFAANIYLSCSWRFHTDISTLGGLSLVIGLAIVKALAEYGIKDDIKIKWPNDIFWRDQKLAGILIEVHAETHAVSHAVISTGLNVNMTPEMAQDISQPWTSLANILGTYQDRNRIVGLLINLIYHYLAEFEKHGLTRFLEQWPNYDFLSGKLVNLKNHHQEISGIAVGVNKHGNLLVKQADGNIIPYSSGDAETQKQSGY